MNNREIAKLLREIAASYVILSEDRFRIIAYGRAADSIEKSTVEAEQLWKEGKLTSVPGIGGSLAAHLGELLKTGKVKHFEDIKSKIPEAVFPLLDIPGFGAKKAYRLVSELKLDNAKNAIKDLSAAAKSGKIASIEGFGNKSQQDILDALKRLKEGQVKENRMPLPYAGAIADDILSYLSKCEYTLQAEFLGSLRRRVATIGDIDIAVSTRNPKEVVDWFLAYPQKEKQVEKGTAGATILLKSGRQVDLRVQYPGRFGAMLQYFTGSKNHNIHLREVALKKRLSLSEYGMKALSKEAEMYKLTGASYSKKEKMFEFPDEKSLYRALDMQYIPPEMREDTGEIEAAGTNKLPDIIGLSDIKGELHIHSNYDLEPSHDLGISSLKEILTTAKSMNYEYVGISDHNPSVSKHTKEDVVHIMERRKHEFEHIMLSNKSIRVNLFIMMEIDILPDGKLALPEEAFNYIDAAVVSIHSGFTIGTGMMTKRVLSALSHPKAKILGHPTGRLLGKRPGYDLDWQQIFKFCFENNKAIEINSYPDRLDLPDSLVREAIKNRVKLVIDTDSHDKEHMSLMKYGVSVARRGWAKKDDILNTLPYNKVKDWLLKP
ncbi:helix-hairpin-helix domain-containing protein [Patescibacteria group bacterium]|nr:helix-hairpin-helix domain-containing protein [Patescibacteria group bacterium]MCL5798254.1 helix-hairpin-helix domain-containing protein [Patescibacteria group bacterium]